MIYKYTGCSVASKDNYFKLNVDRTNTKEHVFSCEKCNMILARVQETDLFAGIYLEHTKAGCKTAKKVNLDSDTLFLK